MTPLRLAAGAAAGAAVAATLPSGGRVFAAAVVLWGLVVVLDVATLLGVAAQRPLVPASAVGAVGGPVGVVTGGATGWDRIPMVMALMLLGAFGLALVSSRKRQITVTLGATVLPALLVGLGAAGVVVLRSTIAGFRWTLGALAVTALPVLLGAMGARLGRPGVRAPASVMATGAAGGALLLGLNPPFGPVAVAVLVAAGLGAVSAAGALTAALAGDVPGGDGRTAALSALVAPLMAAPALAFFAFATQS